MSDTRSASLPRVGVGLPNFGPRADPEAIVTDRDGGGATWLRQRLDVRTAAPARAAGRHESLRHARPQRLGVRPVGDAHLGRGAHPADRPRNARHGPALPVSVGARQATGHAGPSIGRAPGGGRRTGLDARGVRSRRCADGPPRGRVRGASRGDASVLAAGSRRAPRPVVPDPSLDDRTEAREGRGSAARRWHDQARGRARGPAGRRLRRGDDGLGHAARARWRGSATPAARDRSSCGSTPRRSMPSNRTRRSPGRSRRWSTISPEACAAGVDVVVWDLNMADLDAHRQVALLEALASALDARGVTMT